MKKIFVSSTFKDMQYERDLINNVIMPKLKDDCKQFGEDVYFIDLRWGIDTSDVSDVNLDNINNLSNEKELKADIKILNSCMNAIDDCDYFLVLLGNRYGSKFDLTKIYKEAIINELLDDTYSREKSVTEFEIDYGPLNINHKDLLQKTIFMFRDEVTDAPEHMYQNGNSKEEIDENNIKLKSLKKKIIDHTNEFGGKIINYSLKWDKEKNSIENDEIFSNILINEFYSMIKKENEDLKDLSDYEKEVFLNQRYMNKHADKMIYRKDLCEKIMNDLNKNNTVFLYGPNQSGRSVLTSHITREYIKKGYNVSAFFYEAGIETYTDVDMLRHWCTYVSNILNKPFTHMDLNEYGDNEKTLDVFHYYNDALEELLAEYDQTNTTPLLLVSDIHGDLNYLSFITFKKYNHISSLFSFRWEGKKYFDNACQYYLLDYPISTKDYITSKLLEHNKTLSKEVINLIINNNKDNNHLYTTLIIQRLLMMDENDFVVNNNKVDDVIREAHLKLISKLPTEIDKLYLEIVEEIAERLGFEQIINISILLSLCGNTLNKEDIRNILSPLTPNWKDQVLDRFIYAFPLLFEIDINGYIKFDNDYITNALLEKYAKDKIISSAIDYFSNNEVSDPNYWKKLFNYYIMLYKENLWTKYEHSKQFLLKAFEVWLNEARNTNVYNYDEHLIYFNTIIKAVRFTNFIKNIFDYELIFKIFESYKTIEYHLGRLINFTSRSNLCYVTIYKELYEYIFWNMTFYKKNDPYILEQHKNLFEKIYLPSINNYFKLKIKKSILPMVFNSRKQEYNKLYNKKEYYLKELKDFIIILIAATILIFIASLISYFISK